MILQFRDRIADDNRLFVHCVSDSVYFGKRGISQKWCMDASFGDADVDQFYASYHGTQRSVKPDRG